MSNLLHKVKEAIPGTHSNKASEPEGVNGPHSSRAANAADPRIDSDRDNRAAGVVGGTYDNTTYNTGTTGGNYTHSSGQTTAGPHSSNVANKLDPRVDSDRDNSRTIGSNPTTGTHSTTTHTGVGHTGTTGTTHTSGSLPEGTAGPHSSRVANAADPRVDSDLDSSRNRTTGTSGLTGGTTHGTHGTTGTSGLTGTTHGTHGTTGTSGLTGTTHGTHGTTGSNIPEGTVGPHSSRVANAADPRVDSDLDSSRNRGIHGTTGTSGLTGTTHGTHGTTGTSGLTGTTHGTTGSNIPEGTAGPHSSRVANAADPRVDSDLDSSRNRHAGTTGGTGLTTGTNTTHRTGVTGSHAPGPAPDTAGPHKSNLLNKADPRVDSDLDGSKTVGGNKTFNQSQEVTNKDPTDAAQVPPSVLQRHVGAPVPAEEDHHGRHYV